MRIVGQDNGSTIAVLPLYQMSVADPCRKSEEVSYGRKIANAFGELKM